MVEDKEEEEFNLALYDAFNFVSDILRISVCVHAVAFLHSVVTLLFDEACLLSMRLHMVEDKEEEEFNLSLYDAFNFVSDILRISVCVHAVAFFLLL